MTTHGAPEGVPRSEVIVALGRLSSRDEIVACKGPGERLSRVRNLDGAIPRQKGRKRLNAGFIGFREHGTRALTVQSKINETGSFSAPGGCVESCSFRRRGR